MINEPAAVLEGCLTNIRMRNKDLNALVWTDEAGARAAAEASAARHAKKAVLSFVDGMPIAVKANVAVKGAPWTAALMPFRDRIADEDSTIVAQLRRAGAVIVGVANMHEAALGGMTTSPLYGPARNPRNRLYTPGGSSGGSAVAVAAGMAVAAIGTDTMGSVRMPSAYCGVAGIKPSFGRVSRHGVELLSWSLDHVGFHALSIETLRDLLACASFDREDPYAEVYTGSLATNYPLKGLRVACGQTNGIALEPRVEVLFGKAAAALSEAGARVASTLLDLDLARERRRGLLICEAEFASMRGANLHEFLSSCSPDLQAMVGWGARQPAAKLAAAYAVFGEARLAARRIFAGADVLILPTAPQTAVLVEGSSPENQADLTVWANIAGLPSVTVPMGAADGGLPVGCQIIAPRGADGLALSVAAQLEAILKSN